MKTNSYIHYLIDNLDNTLHSLLDKDKIEYFQHLNNNNNNLNVKPFHFSRVDDFVDFYLNDLSFTPQEFIYSFGRDKGNFLNLIYDSSFSYVDIRKKLHNIFSETIIKDLNLFQHCLQTCLRSHLNFDLNANSDGDDYYRNKQLEQVANNRNLFIDLITLGIENDLFSKIDNNILHTKNDKYKKILEEHHLLDEDFFSEKKYIELLKNSFEIIAARKILQFENKTKLTEYQFHYIDDIIKLFPTPEIFSDWANKNLTITKDGTDLLLLDEKNFLIYFCSEFNSSSKEKQSLFLNNWLSSEKLRKSTIDKTNYDIQNIFKNFTDNIYDLLDQTTTKEFEFILNNSDLSNINFNKNSFCGGYINTIVDVISKGDISFELMPKVLDKLLSLEKILPNPIFFDALNVHLTSVFITKIEKSNLLDKKELLTNLTSIFNKYEHLHFSAFSYLNNNLTNYIEQSNIILKSTPDSFNLKNKVGNKLIEFFNETLEDLEENKNRVYDKEKNFNNYIKAISSLQLYDFINTDSLLKLKINIRYEAIKTGKINIVYDFPVPLFIALNCDDTMILKNIFNDKNLDFNMDISFSNKNILNYLLSNKIKKVSEFIDVLKDEPNSFKHFVLNKTTLNKIKKLNNPLTNKIIEVFLMDASLPKKELIKTKTLKM